MKRLVMAVVALAAVSVQAMPTKAELTKAQPLVVELMTPAMNAFQNAAAKEKAAAAVKVGDASSEFAKSAETEAARFLLLKGAVSYYARGEAYDKAADVVAELQRTVKDVPPSAIAEIAGKATGKISETKAPRLYAQYRAAKLQVKAESEAKTLATKLKKVKSDVLQRRYAEALAVSGDWKAAYAEFAKVSDTKLKAIAEAESKGAVKNMEAGEFWWVYKPTLDDADDFFKSHAATFYRQALAAGEITGLKKNIVEQRLNQIDVDVDKMPQATLQKPVMVKDGAYTATVDGLTWSYCVKNGEAEIVAEDLSKPTCCVSPKPVGDFEIPATLGGVKVTSIGKYAFIGCKGLVSVVIPSSVKSIQNCSFYFCSGLTSFTIPETVTYVGGDVFHGCSGIKSMTIPEGITSIGRDTFMGCRGLETMIIPASVKRIDYYAFRDCKGLKSLTMRCERPDVQEQIFNGCGNLTEIHVPAKAKSWAGMTEWQGRPLVFDAK